MSAYQEYFDPSHQLVRDSVRRFVEREMLPGIEQCEEAESFPRELYLKAGAAGILGIGYPEALGGSHEGDLFAKVAASERPLASPHLSARGSSSSSPVAPGSASANGRCLRSSSTCNSTRFPDSVNVDRVRACCSFKQFLQVEVVAADSPVGLLCEWLSNVEGAFVCISFIN